MRFDSLIVSHTKLKISLADEPHKSQENAFQNTPRTIYLSSLFSLEFSQNYSQTYIFIAHITKA